jgi:HSP20 family molecular chaperone IbpA
MYAPAGRALERFMEETQRANSQKASSVEQDEQSFTLSFDVPGVSRDQLSIGIEGNVVRLSTKEGSPRQYRHACELPQDIDAAKSEAKLELGVLKLKIAKVVAMRRVTELTIQ